ncbi:MAG: monodechloroaminopyrrolnitrin synthase PrnB family protein, partial [Pseudomonadota bacterium]|nr:monodechloroaminopyrrolnitrin synthase PrnB family protein [Pseudomonadota bacterium]
MAPDYWAHQEQGSFAWQRRWLISLMGISVSVAAKRFDNWIRTEFVELNTELEEIYFHQDDKADVEGSGTEIKEKLVGQGRALIGLLLKEGNTQKDFHSVFNMLGNVGLFLAS